MQQPSLDDDTTTLLLLIRRTINYREGGPTPSGANELVLNQNERLLWVKNSKYRFVAVPSETHVDEKGACAYRITSCFAVFEDRHDPMYLTWKLQKLAAWSTIKSFERSYYISPLAFGDKWSMKPPRMGLRFAAGQRRITIA